MTLVNLTESFVKDHIVAGGGGGAVTGYKIYRNDLLGKLNEKGKNNFLKSTQVK